MYASRILLLVIASVGLAAPAGAQSPSAKGAPPPSADNMIFDGAEPAAPGGDVLYQRMLPCSGTATGVAEPTLVFFGDPGTAATEIAEDLKVMTLLIRRKLRADSDRAMEQRMGIPMLVTGEPAGSRSIFIEGLGAVFLLEVDPPVVEPEAKAETTKEPAAPVSDWEKARRDLRGQGPGGVVGREDELDRWRETAVERAREVRANVIEVLKEASNIRHLRSDDIVAVCVRGGPRRPPGAAIGGVPGSVQESTAGRELALARGATIVVRSQRTVLSIKAKKSDVEAFARGDLTAADFEKMATIAAYVDTAASPSSSFAEYLQLIQR